MLAPVFFILCIVASATAQCDGTYTPLTVTLTTSACYKVVGGNVDVYLNGVAVGANYFSVGISATSAMSSYRGVVFQGGATAGTPILCNSQSSGGVAYTATGYTTATATIAAGVASIHIVRPLTTAPAITLGANIVVGIVLGPGATCTAGGGCGQHTQARSTTVKFAATTTTSTSTTTTTSTTTGTSSTTAPQTSTTAPQTGTTAPQTGTTAPQTGTTASQTGTSTSAPASTTSGAAATGGTATGATGAQGIVTGGTTGAANSSGGFSGFVKNPTGLGLIIGAGIAVVLFIVAVVVVVRMRRLNAASNGGSTNAAESAHTRY